MGWWIWTHLPSLLGMSCVALCAIVPYALHRVNKALRDATDPPWKREDRQGGEGSA
ncbi:hypothetical protein [Cohnella sp. GCM10027633]|uniref:hypothetical protein n=1 Tax=unclassified Cohnella TaxID=2636738 RepID=UPI003634B3E3